MCEFRQVKDLSRAAHQTVGQTLDALFAGRESVTWEEFMFAALYDSRSGYYTTRIKSVGREGDFSTSATIDGALAQSVCEWFRASRRGNRFIELGGGDGSFAREFRRRLGVLSRWRTRYDIVEISDGLQAMQRAALRFRGGIRWHTRIEDAIAVSRYPVTIFGNEFVDAFPCVVLRRSSGGEWHELAVRRSASGLSSFWATPSSRALGALAYSTGCDLAVDSVCEIHLAFREWLERVSALDFTGTMLLIDYGDVFPNLYKRRPSGTLRGYFAQQRIEGAELLHRFGRQDLTSDVNFSDVARWATELGWTVGDTITQADFTKKWNGGSASRVSDLADAGGAFRVIQLQRGRCPS
jgi:SAM-dependent MidA family methyltransferase